MTAMRAARAACVLTLGAAATAERLISQLLRQYESGTKYVAAPGVGNLVQLNLLIWMLVGLECWRREYLSTLG
jgi:hypothetical protein